MSQLLPGSSAPLSGTSAFLQPLHVDTDIDYSLDMSKFPGLDSQQHEQQPALLIGTPENVAQYERQIWSDMGYVNTRQEPMQHYIMDTPVYKQPSVGNTCILSKPSIITTRDLLEELLNIIDSGKSDLLDRILESSLQSEMVLPPDSQFSGSGVIQQTQRQQYVYGYSQYQDVNRNIPFQDVFRDASPLEFSSGIDLIPDYVLNLSALSYQSEKVRSRKRFLDDGDDGSRKRGCYNVHDQYNAFHENLHNRNLIM